MVEGGARGVDAYGTGSGGMVGGGGGDMGAGVLRMPRNRRSAQKGGGGGVPPLAAKHKRKRMSRSSAAPPQRSGMVGSHPRVSAATAFSKHKSYGLPSPAPLPLAGVSGTSDRSGKTSANSKGDGKRRRRVETKGVSVEDDAASRRWFEDPKPVRSLARSVHAHVVEGMVVGKDLGLDLWVGARRLVRNLRVAYRLRASTLSLSPDAPLSKLETLEEAAGEEGGDGKEKKGRRRRMRRGKERFSLRRRFRFVNKVDADVVRLLPFVVLKLLPMSTLTIALAIRTFPSLLPSTFKLRMLESMQLEGAATCGKRAAKVRSAAAAFLAQMDVARMEATLRNELSDSQMAPLRYIRRGSPVSAEAILEHKDVFLSHMKLVSAPVPALRSLATRLHLSAYGPRLMLLVRLYRHLNTLARDSALIHREGVHALSHDELVSAVRERGLRFQDLSESELAAQLREFNVLMMEGGSSLVESLLLFAHGTCVTELYVAPSRH